MGKGQAPGGKHVGQIGERPAMKDVVRGLPKAPKLHYHQSGLISTDLTGQVEKVRLHGLPLRLMHGGQFFSCTVLSPERLPAAEPERGETFAAAHEVWPMSVDIYGFAIARSRVRSSVLDQLADGLSMGLVLDEVAETVIDLSAHGSQTIVALRFSLGYDYPPLDEPEGWLFGFDTKSLQLDMMSDVIGMWTNDVIPKAIGLAHPETGPFTKQWSISPPFGGGFLVERNRPPGTPGRDIKRIARGSKYTMGEQDSAS